MVWRGRGSRGLKGEGQQCFEGGGAAVVWRGRGSSFLEGEAAVVWRGRGSSGL